MKKLEKIAVTSRSFSRHPLLRAELLEKYQYVKFNDEGEKLIDHALVNFLKDVDKAIIGLEKIDETILQQLPQLKVISKFGVGLDKIDAVMMNTLGVQLSYTPGINKRAVSELVIGLALSLLRKLPEVNQHVRDGKWLQYSGAQLSGKKVGIIGFGAIGQDLAFLLKNFSCDILFYDAINIDLHHLGLTATQVSLEDLLREADIISLHLPLNASTRYILNETRLKLIKSSAMLINTARGELVDEIALKTLLRHKKIAAAAFDVFAEEPPLDKELLLLPNFLATSHIAGSTEESNLAMGRAAIRGLERCK